MKMKLILIACHAAALLASRGLAIDPKSQSADSSTIVVVPNKGELSYSDSGVQAIRVTFPTPMVGIERIKRVGQPSPILFDPIVEAGWIWVSQTEGKLFVPDLGSPVLRILHRARLRPGLKDLADNPVDTENWGAEFMHEKFALRRLHFLNVWEDQNTPDDPETDEASGNAKADGDKASEDNGDVENRKIASPLVAHPIVQMEFSRDVAPLDVTKAVYFQDRVTHEKFPVQVNLEESQSAQAQGWFRVEPIAALPPGRSYLLVIDPLKAPKTNETLPHLRVVQAGSTFPMIVRRVVGLNQPSVGAFVRVTTNHTVDPDPANFQFVQIQPAVKNLRLEPHEYTLDIRGDFNTATEYRVTLKAGLKSTAFDLDKDSVWKVHFHPKRPAIILTTAVVFQPASVHFIRQSFQQINTQRLDWTVARIPREKIEEVYTRVREFEEALKEHDPTTGEYKYQPTELLIPGLGLKTVASGTLDASGEDQETERQIEWTPESPVPGVYLLEISGKDSGGRIIGNRLIISRTDTVSTEIDLSAGIILRIRDINSGKPAAGVPVEILKSGKPSVPVATDTNGEVFLKESELQVDEESLAKAMLVGQPGSESLHLIGLPTFPSGNPKSSSDTEDESTLQCAIVTDRNMYRPGDTVKFKGFARNLRAGKLAIPSGDVEWRIDAIAGKTTEPPLYSEKAKLSPNGSWEGSWQISDSALGDYFIKAGTSVEKVTVSEFRPPAFSVKAEAEALPGGVVRARVSSMHFHGAPNANAKVHWKAEWIVDDWSGDRERDDESGNERRLVLDDQFSQESTSHGLSDEMLAKAGWDTAREDRDVSTSASTEGDATLDASGAVTLECKSPFAKGTPIGRAKVFWLVDVTSAAAQTLRGGAVAKVQFVPQILGVKLRQSGGKTVDLEVGSYDAEDEPAAGLAAKAELFRVETKTVKEILGPNLNRYRNSPVFEKIWEGEVTTPAQRTVKVPAAGNYMVRVVATNQPGTPQVSDSDMVDGLERAEVPVLNDSSLACRPDRKHYEVGETASIAVQSPYGGTAVMTVETDRILSRQVIELQGNAERIPLPILAAYAPNAWVCVHLLKPSVTAAPGSSAPAERFGACEIKVSPTDHRLTVTTTLAAEKTEPGSNVAGTIKVSVGGRPVDGADVMVFAVDEAVLALGRWRLPDFESIFFPSRSWDLKTHSALGKLWNPDAPGALSHSEKGFILGDTGLGIGETSFRKDFKALAFWDANLRANVNGEVSFHFKAPDGLTSYRVVAVAQNGIDQFGNGHATVKLAKNLQIEPALTDFLRHGDEVFLRTVVRQDYADADEIEVKLNSTGVQLLEAPLKTIPVKRGDPLVVSFHVKVLEDVFRATLGFSARSRSQPDKSDAEEDAIPVYPAVIEKRESVFGAILPAKPLDVSAAVPANWLVARGQCDVMISGSPFLPKLAGLRALLEGQGSIEKISTRILAGTLLDDTFKYLPMDSGVEKRVRTMAEEGLRRFSGTVLDAGGVPVWPGGNKLNEFATVEAAWAILSAAQHGFDVDEALCRRAKSWLDSMIAKKLGFDEISPDIRCLALMVRGSTWEFAGKSSSESEKQNAKDFEAEAGELFENRHELSDEGRAWLALGMHYFDILPEQIDQLLRELGQPSQQETEFDPVTFSSKARTEAIRLFAHSEIESTNWSRDARARARQSFDRIAQSSVDLSTQEDLWLLMAFNSLVSAEISPEMRNRRLAPKPQLSSANGISVGWLNLPLTKLPTIFARPLQPGVAGSYLIRATFELPDDQLPQHDPSLSLDRMVRNVTAPGRNGSAEAPFALGDQILITYRLEADKAHSFLEVEDQLPACLETVNPNHPLVAQYFKLPIEAGVNTLSLSNVELRLARTLLYFDKANPGRSLYSVLARVTAAGAFHWPATQVRPMYDSRFSGTSESVIVHAQ
jgi:uncharacterized protein YfaS (alpha-2-macroglobulin family)